MQVDCDNESDDDSEDGGVALQMNLFDSHRIYQDESASADTVEMMEKYHQQPPGSMRTSWELPVAPIAVAKPRQLKNAGITHGIAHAYHKHCYLISKHWRCAASECIPPQLREYTPYSLAMLTLLRRLASSTKKQPEVAQALLLQSFKDRTGAAPPDDQSDTFFETKTTIKTGITPCEEKVREDARGLTLADVQHACLFATKTKRAARPSKRKGPMAKRERAKNAARSKGEGRKPILQQVSEDRKLAMKLEYEEQQSEVAKRIAQRRTSERLAKQARVKPEPIDELVDVRIGYNVNAAQPDQELAAPPNSPVADHHMADQREGIGRRTRSQAGQSGQTFLELAENDWQAEEGFRQPKQSRRQPKRQPNHQPNRQPIPQDQHEARHMSNMLSRMDMESEKGPKRKLERHLQGGGFSRRQHQTNSMPLERMDFNALPSLQMVTAMTNTERLAALGQLPLPTVEQQMTELSIQQKEGAGSKE